MRVLEHGSAACLLRLTQPDLTGLQANSWVMGVNMI